MRDRGWVCVCFGTCVAVVVGVFSDDPPPPPPPPAVVLTLSLSIHWLRRTCPARISGMPRPHCTTRWWAAWPTPSSRLWTAAVTSRCAAFKTRGGGGGGMGVDLAFPLPPRLVQFFSAHRFPGFTFDFNFFSSFRRAGDNTDRSHRARRCDPPWEGRRRHRADRSRCQGTCPALWWGVLCVCRGG